MDRRKRGTKRKDSGFTLVELLVVIGLVGLLIAILLPSLRLARGQGYKVVCQSRMRQLGMAHVMYQEDHEGMVVPASQDGGVGEYWYNTLGPYFNHNSTIHGTGNAADAGRAILRCPLDKLAYPMMLNPHGDDPEGWLSYAFNSQPTRNLMDRELEIAGVGGYRVFRIKSPATAMFHVDFAYRAWVCDSVTLTRHQYGSEPGAHYDAMPGYPEQNETVAAAYRHNRRMNIVWGDGHVSLFEGKIPSAEERPTFWGPLYDNLHE